MTPTTEPPANIRIYLMFLETRIIGLHFAADNIGLSSLKFFSGGLHKTILLLQHWRFGRSRSSNVNDFRTNQRRICNFLLVRHANLGPILHRFGDIAGFVFCAQASYTACSQAHCQNLLGQLARPHIIAEGRTGRLSHNQKHNRALRSIAR